METSSTCASTMSELPTGRRQGRCIGIIGGLGPGATALYYQALVRQALRDLISPDIVIVHADSEKVLGFVEQENIGALTQYLSSFIQRLANAGATAAIIPAVAPHICATSLKMITTLPIIDLLDVIRETLRVRCMRRVALFGTRFVINSDMFGELRDFQVIRPSHEEVEVIHNTYLQIVKSGHGNEEQACMLNKFGHDLIDREHLDGIVLAGTELSLLSERGGINFPAIDCAKVHVAEIARYAGQPR